MDKHVFSIKEAAEHCRVSPRVVSALFERGSIQGYRMPGTFEVKIPWRNLIAFLRSHGLPLRGIEEPTQ